MTEAPLQPAEYIQTTYDQLAQLGQSDLCCSPISLYSPEEIAALPDEVLRLSSGCGHPVDDADIAPGATVLDIGSGAGADCLLAARRTGPTGRVIGVDPSPAMRARASTHRDELGLSWITYWEGTADALPVGDGEVDLVISNCVLSLSTDPDRTWGEIARVLRGRGSVVVSDIVGGADTDDLDGKTRCESGVEWPQYQCMLRRHGFTGIRVLHVRQATFRDGATAASVTFSARHGMPVSHASIDIVHASDERGAAQRLQREIADLARAKQLPLSIRQLPLGDPIHEPTVNLLLAGMPTPPPLSVAVDSAVVCTAITDPRQAAAIAIDAAGS